MKVSQVTMGVVVALVVAVVLIFSLYTGWPYNHMSPPALADSIITEKVWLSSPLADRELTSVLVSRFPKGTPANAMTSNLLAEGFRTRAPYAKSCGQSGCTYSSNILEYSWGGFPCGQEIEVTWTTDQRQLLTSINGNYSPSCI